jgi:hypothetical protein
VGVLEFLRYLNLLGLLYAVTNSLCDVELRRSLPSLSGIPATYVSVPLLRLIIKAEKIFRLHLPQFNYVVLR